MKINGCEPPARRVLLLVVGAVALLAAFAGDLFPVWDDGGTKIWADSGSPDHIRDELSDRPLFANILQFLADHGQLKTGGLVFYLLTWGGMAAVALGWCRILGASFEFTASTVLLTLAPILCQMQFILVNPVISGALGPVLAHAAALALVFASASGTKARTAVRAAAIGLVFAGGMLSEYGVAAAFVCGVVLWPLGTLSGRRASLRFDALLLIIAAVVTYWIYRDFAAPEARLSVRPEMTNAATHFYRLKMLPLRTVHSLWQVAVGQTAAAVATVEWATKWGVVGAAFGVAVAAAGLRFLSGGCDVRPHADFLLRTSVVALLATVVGLLPALLMGRTLTDAYTSRFLLPFLPFAAALSASVWRRLLRTDRRLLFMALFLFGTTVVTQGLHQRAVNKQLAALNAQLRTYADSHARTLVIVEADWPPPYRKPRGFELTAKLTAGWPAVQSDNVWAEAGIGDILGENLAHRNVRPGDHRKLELFEESYFRRWAVDRILYVKIGAPAAIAEVSISNVRDDLP
jgi:hypothetical protein